MPNSGNKDPTIIPNILAAAFFLMPKIATNNKTKNNNAKTVAPIHVEDSKMSLKLNVYL